MNKLIQKKNLRILVIDDNRAIHQDFRKILCPTATGGDSLADAESVLFGAPDCADGRIPFEIDSAYQGAEALALVEEAMRQGRPYAMAFVDVRMPPGWDGVETTARLWEICPDLQIVICTAYSDFSWEEMMSRLRSSDQLLILKKPFDSVEVLQLANALTEKWSLHQQSRLRLEELERIVQERTRVLQETNASLQSEIAEREQSAQALRESEERYELLFSKNPLPMAVFDAKTLAFLAANEMTVQAYGYTVEELLSMSVNDVRVNHQVSPNLLPLEEAPETSITTFPAKHRKKDGTVIDVEIILRPIIYRGRQAMLSLANDVTEKKKLEAQLLRAQRMEGIGTLATGMAHDLNNILAPILISAGMLRYDIAKEDKESTICRIESSVQRAAEIIKQVVTFGRGVSGERVRVNPSELINEVSKISSQTFPKNVLVTADTNANVWPIIGDKTQLHQVLLNLCINARDAMPDGGRLSMQLENFMMDEAFASQHMGLQPGPYVQLKVSDTGMGIPKPNLEKIFEPFFTTKELGKGTGLGLSTVLGIVKSHHGLVTVESELDKGTTFKVILPASVGTAKGTAQKPPAPLPHGRGERILVVDDEAHIVGATRRMLELRGYQVLVADQGREALHLFANDPQPIDLVLTDIMMPGMDGVDLIRSLRAINPQVKIIASSGLGRNLAGSLRGKDLEALGVRTFLTKPYTAEKLLTALQDLLGNELPGADHAEKILELTPG